MKWKVIRNNSDQVVTTYGRLSHYFNQNLGLGERAFTATKEDSECDYSEIYFDSIHIGLADISFNKKAVVKTICESEYTEMLFLLNGNWNRFVSVLDNTLDIQCNQHNIAFLTPSENTSLFSSMSNSIKVLKIHISPERFLRYLPTDNALFDRFKNSILNKRSCYLSPFYHRITPKMHFLISEIINCNRTGIMKRLFYESKVLELLILQLEQFNQVDTKGNHELSKQNLDRIYAVKEYLTKNMDQPTSLTKLANLFGTNEFTLKKGFKEVYGSSVFSFWNDLKMEQAKIMLLETDQLITEISSEFGYSNPRHFSTAFKRKFGFSPSETRKGKH